MTKSRFAERMRCTYCHEVVPKESMNSEHVFPHKWYWPDAPPNEPKIQVPGCRKCNEECQQIEDRLLLKWAPALSPEDPRTKVLWERWFRSIDPERIGRGNEGRRARLRSDVSDLLPASELEGAMGYAGQPFGATVKINPDDVEAFGNKLVRGLLRWDMDVLPPLDVRWVVRTASKEATQDVVNGWKAIQEIGVNSYGADSLVCIGVGPPSASSWLFSVWRTHEFFVLPAAHEPKRE